MKCKLLNQLIICMMLSNFRKILTNFLHGLVLYELPFNILKCKFVSHTMKKYLSQYRYTINNKKLDRINQLFELDAYLI